MSENTTIKDTKVDKLFIIGLFNTILAFIVNIILGSYVIYVSKILQFIELPTDINKYPYTDTDTDINTKHEVNNKFVGINYLYTELTDPNSKDNDSTDNKSNSSWKIVRELLFTKINVDQNDNEQIYNPNNFFKDLYKGSNWVTITYIKLIIQQIYCFYYWAICIFFKFINGYDNITKSESWSIYLWETLMMLIGFPLFILYSIFLTIGLLFYIPYIILKNILIIWDYDYKNHITKTDDSTSSLFSTIWRGYSAIIIICFLFGFSMWWLFLVAFAFIGLPFLLPFFIYIFASLLRIKSTIVQNDNKDTIDKDEDKNKIQYPVINLIKYISKIFHIGNKSSSYGYNILSFISILIGIMSIGIGNLFGVGSTGSIAPAIIYIIYFIISDIMIRNKEKYSVTNILLSKIEPITYIIAIIFFGFSAFYGTTVYIIVGIIFLALWGLSKKHQLLFYPYTPSINNNIFTTIKFDSYNIGNTTPILCSSNTPVNINNILNEIATNKSN